MGSLNPKQLTISNQSRNLLRAFTTTFFLTLTNPMTILSFMAVFAGLGLGTVSTGYVAASIVIAGIVIGSLLWWLLLSSGVAILFRNKINQSKLYWVNFLSGAVIIIFGLVALVSLIK